MKYKDWLCSILVVVTKMGTGFGGGGNVFWCFPPRLPGFLWYQCWDRSLGNLGANFCTFLAQLSCRFIKIIWVVICSVKYCLRYWRNHSTAKVSLKSSLAYWCLLFQIKLNFLPNDLMYWLLCVIFYCCLTKTLLDLYWWNAVPPLLPQFIIETTPECPIFLPLDNGQYLFFYLVLPGFRPL